MKTNHNPVSEIRNQKRLLNEIVHFLCPWTFSKDPKDPKVTYNNITVRTANGIVFASVNILLSPAGPDGLRSRDICQTVFSLSGLDVYLVTGLSDITIA